MPSNDCHSTSRPLQPNPAVQVQAWLPLQELYCYTCSLCTERLLCMQGSIDVDRKLHHMGRRGCMKEGQSSLTGSAAAGILGAMLSLDKGAIAHTGPVPDKHPAPVAPCTHTLHRLCNKLINQLQTHRSFTSLSAGQVRVHGAVPLRPVPVSLTEGRSQTEASSDWLELPFSPQAGDGGPGGGAPKHPGAWEVSAKVC